MSTPVSSEPRSLAKPRRWRRIFQFSLRTLLILTTAAAVGCWWYLQPRIYVEELAGGALKLRRQVRERGKNEMVFHRSLPGNNFVDIGAWQLRDQRNAPLAKGRYADGEPHGWWRVYHANGRKAAEGQMLYGLRVGVWKTWDEQGRRESEVTYAGVRMPQRRGYFELARSRKSSFPGTVTTIPVVGTIAPLTNIASFPAIIAGLRLGRHGRYEGSLLVSVRHGPAKTWYAKGGPKETGDYALDRRNGRWTFYDEQGCVVKTGEYRNGLREGCWAIRAPDGKTETIEFVGDRSRHAYELRVAELRAELASSDLDRQVIAMEQIESLGRQGVSLLVESLQTASGELKLVALRRLERLAIDDEGAMAGSAAETPIKALLDSADDRVALLAALVLYEAFPEGRDKWYARLIENVRQSSDRDGRMQALFTAWNLDPDRRSAIFTEIASAADRPDAAAILFAPSDELVVVLNEASLSAETKVRRLAIEVVVVLTQSGPPEVIKLPTGGQELRSPVPESLKKVVERAKRDTDATIREAADAVGKWPDPRRPARIGSVGMRPFLPASGFGPMYYSVLGGALT